MTRVLPEDVRGELKNPLGRLVRGDKPGDVARRAWASDRPVVAVGDIVTCHLVGSGRVPDVSVIDDRSMREETGEDVRRRVRTGYDTSLFAKNPPGHLTDELVEVLDEAFDREGKVQVVVEGEEDLAVLPVVQKAETGTRVLYGQPSEGVVVIDVTDERKREIKRLVNKMEVIDGPRGRGR